MENFTGILDNLDWGIFLKTGLRIVFILIFALILMKMIKVLLQRLEKHLIIKSEEAGEPPSESAKRVGTITRLVKQILILVLWGTVILVILKDIGMEIAPIIASAGIVGLAIGFGAQNLIRDIISGFFMILENQIRMGDVAIVNGTGGLVEKINFRTIVLRDLSGVVHIFPNGTVTTLSNMTNEWSAYVFDIGVAYKENTDRAIEVMKEVGSDMLKDNYFGKIMLREPEFFGVDKFADSAVIIKGRLTTKPIRQWETGREFLRRVKIAFDENNIEIPFPHRTVYYGEASKPFDLQIVERLQSQEKIQTETK